MPNRHASTSEYRYGFNDKEKDDEVKGEGNWQEYGMRMYDPRVGRFPNVDPLTKKYPELTPYQFASNRPIQAIDLDGLEAADAQSKNILKYITTDQDGDLVTINHTYNLNKPAITLKTYLSTSIEGSGTYVFKSTFNYRPKTGFVESMIIDANNTFSYDVASRDKIKGNYANISIIGVGNTFRHLLLSTVLTASLGKKWAKHITDVKENNEIEGSLSLDNQVDLVNNAWGRLYAENNNIVLKDVIKNETSATKFLNDLAVYTLNSIKEYKTNPAYKDIISGKIKIFNEGTNVVKNFIETAKAFIDNNQEFVTNPNKDEKK